MKQAIVFGILTVVIFIVVGISFAGQQKIETDINAIFDNQFIKVVKYNQIIDCISDIVLNLYRCIVLENRPTTFTEMEQLVAKNKEYRNKANALYADLEVLIDPTGPGRDVFEKVIATRTVFRANQDRLEDLIHNHNLSDATIVIQTTFRASQEAYFDALSDAINFNTQRVGNTGATISEYLKRYLYIIFIVAAVGLIIAGALSIMSL